MIRVGIVDDHAIVRTSLHQLLADHADLDVVGEARDGREAIDLVRTRALDVLVMDVDMPGQSGLDVMAMLRAKAPQVGILILSGYPETQYALNLMKRGASGYLNKGCDLSEIVLAVRTISLGRRFITPAVADLMVQQLNDTSEQPMHSSLSDREMQILLKIARGARLQEICKTLSLSNKTVSTYRSRIMAKMDFCTTGELTYYALKNKLIG
jgi:two-component system invasion response regulator UvrY